MVEQVRDENIQRVNERLIQQVLKYREVQPHMWGRDDTRVYYWTGGDLMPPSCLKFSAAEYDQDAFAVLDRLLVDYAGTALNLSGPAWGANQWMAAITSSISVQDVQFVVAETRTLAVCLAMIRFLDQYGDMPKEGE